MTSSLRTRLDHMERQEGNPMERYIASMTEGELDARANELSVRLRAELEAQGHDCTSLDNVRLVKLAQDTDPTWPKAGAL